MKKILFSTMSAVLMLAPSASAQIRINQVGMYPQQEKTAVVEGKVKAGNVKITDASTGKQAEKPVVLRTAVSPWSGKTRTVVDFSSLTQPGRYVIQCAGQSAEFTVGASALRDATAATLKAFYLNRTAMPIEAAYAGEYARRAAHPDTTVYIHPSAASLGRPEGTVISSPLGWYDAGDYNKYIVNSAFSVGIMLASYEQNQDYFRQLSVNIPESKNGTPDVLDELMYNLKWMITMQDPYDGGVYHKLTTPNFEAFIMPSECKQKRYVVQKSTAATLDFAAVMAQAARIYKGNKDYPDFSAQAAKAAIAAYGWAEHNPHIYYRQGRMNEQFKPEVSTGDYGDGNVSDEWYWAATELYLLTGDKQFLTVVGNHQPHRFTTPVWGNVRTLGSYEWMMHQPTSDFAQSCRKQLVSYCDSIVATTAASAFQTPNGNSPRDFGWGCLAETFCANGLSLLYAYRLTGNKAYLTAAQQNADYIFGRNATGYCYLTGFGSKSPMFPHHRISASDGIEKPLPGMLVGGPNPGQQDIANVKSYPSKEPDESYADVTDSYASNEIAINWNASLLAMLGWLEAEQGKSEK